MLRSGCSIVIFLLLVLEAKAQNQFRSVQTGDWNQTTTWEEFIAGTWQPATTTPDFTSAAITIQSPHVVTVTTDVSIDQSTVASGATLIINNTINLTLNNATGIDLTTDGTIQFLGEGFLSGTGQFTLTGTLRLGSLNTTGALLDGTGAGNIRTSGARTYNASATVIYEGVAAQFIGDGHPTTAGLTTNIDNTNGVTFDQNTNGNTGASSRLSITGPLILTAGNLNIVSTLGTGRTLALSSTVTPNGNSITVAGPSTNLLLEGSGDIIPFPFPAGAQSLSQITITRPGNTITFNSAISLSTRLAVDGDAIFNGTLTSRDIQVNTGSLELNGTTSVTGALDMGAATTLDFTGAQLSLAGDYNSSGLLTSDASSSLILTGGAAHSSPLSFQPGSSLQTLSINKGSAGTAVTIGSSVTITSILTLTAGTVSNVGGNLTMANNSSISKSSSANLITSSPSGGPWNLTYTNSSQSTSLEVPASGILASLTISTNSTTTVTLTQSIVVNGALNIPSNSRTLLCGANNVTAGSFSNSGTFSAPSSGASTGFTLNGNLVNNGTYTHNSGTLIIGGASVMSGTAINTTNFRNITIGASGSLTAPTTLNISGNLTNNGTFTAGAGSLIFNGAASSLLGSNMATTTFNNITINAGATLTQASNLILTGNLVVTGTLTVGAATNTFAGTTTVSGTNAPTTQFNHIVINPASTLVAPSTLRVGGDFTNNGTFTAGTSTVLFTGTSSLSGSTINSTNFNNITINVGATLTPSTTLNVLGNFANSGTFNAGAGTVALSGNAGSKTISGATNTQFFNLTMNKSNGGTSVTVSSPQTITNSLSLLDGIMDNTGGNLSLNSGTTITRTNLASITASPSGGPWHLIYQGASVTSSLEIPVSGTLVSLTIDVDNTRNVTLSQSITVQNAISIPNSGRALICGNNNVTAASLSNSGTFSAPGNASPSGLIISGNFTNNGTFTHNNGLVTFNGTTTLSGSSTTAFSRITISGTLNASSSFSVAGHFTNNGTFSAPPLVTFNGSALQNFTGSTLTTTFRGMRVTNTTSPVSLSILSNINLIDSLSLASNAKVDADGSSDTAVLTLISTNDSPAADAKISRLPAGASVLGSVTVQRFFRPADNFDRFFSSPVTNATVAQIQASTPAGSFPITGGFPGTSFPCTGCNNDGHNFRYYYEPEPGIINKGYKGFITSTSSILTPGVGYDAFMWNGVSNTTMSLRGPINSGTITLGVQPGTPGTSITRTNNGQPSADGWNLVGNPYPSPIEWKNGGGWTRSNIDPTVWVWDVVGRVWHSFNANTQVGDLTNGVIAAGQGFWVLATAGAGSITVNENVKSYGVAGTGSYYRTQADARQKNGGPAFKISLSNGESTDHVFVLSDPGATAGYDPGLDAWKLQIGIEQLSLSLLDETNRKLGHYVAGSKFPDRMPLYVFGEADGEFSLRFENLENVAALDGYYLVDEYLGESMLIAPGQSYSFTMTASDPMSQEERFFLSRYPGVEKQSPSYQLVAYPNPASDVLTIQYNTAHVQEISLLDNSGRRVIQVIPSGNDGVQEIRLDVGNQPAGLYILKVVTNSTIETKKILVKH